MNSSIKPSALHRLARFCYYQVKVNLSGYFGILILFALKFYRPYRFMIVGGYKSNSGDNIIISMDGRIGHFLGAMDYYLRRKNLDQGYGTAYDVLLCDGALSNRTIVEMTRQYIPVVCSDFLRHLIKMVFRIKPKHPAIYVMPHIVYAPDIFNNTPAPFCLTEEQKKNGQTLLKQMGIPSGAPVITFAVRDQAYMEKSFVTGNENGWDYHSYRNPDFDAYVEMAENLADQGYWLVRMGSIVASPLLTQHPRIIDYSTHHRTDFGDVFLASYCTLFICDSAGIGHLSHAQGGCGLRTNLNIADLYAPWPNFMSLPVKYLDIDSNRIITYSEAIKRGILTFGRTDDFRKEKIRIVYNTGLELTEAALDILNKMNSGSIVGCERDELEHRFFSLYPENHGLSLEDGQFEDSDARSPIAPSFLNRHEQLIK